MTQIVWTQTARGDLHAIRAYIAQDSVHYANRFIDRIKSAVERLRRFPLSGAKVAEWDREDVREILVGNYRVIYRVALDQVYIVTVIHAARELPDVDSLH